MSDTPVSRVLNALQSVTGFEPVRNGDNWSACCPAHDDRNPSLSVAVGDDDRVLLKCHPGCSPQNITRALGLTMADLFPAKSERGNNRDGKGKLGRIIKTYDYRDATGKLLFQVVRYDPKGFRQRRPDGKGGWVWNRKGVERVLYNLPALLAADPSQPVFVVEGEKDADALTALGLIATTCPQGAGKWHLVDGTPLHGHHVVIVPDNDKSGREHAEQEARTLHGKVSGVKVVSLPGLPEHGDVSDWLANGGTADELLRIVEETPEYEPTATEPTTGKSSSRAMVVRLADVTPRPVKWLWSGRIPCGMFTLLFGDPGLGKSIVTLDLAARVSCGRIWPDQAENVQGSVIILSAEDDVTYTIRPRLEAARADMSRIITIQGVKHTDEKGGESRTYFSLETDLTVLRDAILSMPDTRLVIIDPISAYCGGVNSHRNAEVRGLLAPLSELTAEMGIALVCVTHLNKTVGRKALYRATGSLAYVATARAGWLVIQDPDNPKRRLMLMAKMNVAPPMPGMAFTIEPEHVEGVGSTGCVCWSRDPVNMTADDALAAEGADDGKDNAHARNEAAEWLRDQLAEGPVPKKALEREAKDAGLAWRTIRRAKGALGVRATKKGFGDEGVWMWVLPDSKGGQPDPVTNDVATLGEVGHLSVFDSARGGNSGVEGGQSLKGGQPYEMDTLGEDAASEPADSDDDPPLAELHARIDAEWAGDPDADLLPPFPGLAVGQGLDGGDVQVGDDGPSVTGQGDEQAGLHQGDGLGVADGVGLAAGSDDSEWLERLAVERVSDVVGDHVKIVAPDSTPLQGDDVAEGDDVEWTG